jgi:hypothetical protein
MKFYDSNTGNLLFAAPKSRTHQEFWTESNLHGWPSFRDDEVNWKHVRCLKNGECVSIDGTHLVRLSWHMFSGWIVFMLCPRSHSPLLF